MYEIKFIKNPPTQENLKSLCESELYQNILKDFSKISKEKFDEREQDNMRLINILTRIERRYLILNIPFEEILLEFENHKDGLLKYCFAKNDFYKEDDDDLSGEIPEGEELGKEDKPEIIEVFGISKFFLLDNFCEFYLLKTGDKERLLHYLKTTRMPFAKKYAGEITKIYRKTV